MHIKNSSAVDSSLHMYKKASLPWGTDNQQRSNGPQSVHMLLLHQCFRSQAALLSLPLVAGMYGGYACKSVARHARMCLQLLLNAAAAAVVGCNFSPQLIA
jgi:hypothetical protein